jgi:hypothetical protein
MKLLTKRPLHWLAAATFAFCSMASLATPKAAEHEDAPVTTGADVAKPMLSAKPAKQQVTVKPKKATKGKPVNTAKPAKKAKVAH